MAKKSNNQGKLSKETKSLLRQSRKKWRSVKRWAEWRQEYAERTNGAEHDDVEPSAKNKTGLK